MSLIIFHQRRSISFQRFAYSIVAGALLLWLLGRLHALVHFQEWQMFATADVDLRLILVGVGVGTAISLVYLWSGLPPLDIHHKAEPAALSLRDKQALFSCRSVSILAGLVNASMLLFGLCSLIFPHVYRWYNPAVIMEEVALAILGVMLPVNFVFKLLLESWMRQLPDFACWLVEASYGLIMYWVLLAFWACWIATYIILLALSQAYCRYTVCWI